MTFHSLDELNKTLKDIDLLEQTSKKWYRIMLGQAEDRGPEDCPCCQVYNLNSSGESCTGCPIYEHTQKKWCIGTPYPRTTESDDIGPQLDEYDFLLRIRSDLINNMYQ
jgi:hypothetical protein